MHYYSKPCILIAASFCMATLMQSYLSVAESPSDFDKIITSLPGQPDGVLDFSQYAGYIKIGNPNNERFLFYYLVEAEGTPSEKPLVLWLNGGPGCSSIGYGAFSGNGPFRVSGDVLTRNAYSWNKEANMLYLDSPAGVGFSYLKNVSYYVNDEITAQDNLEFLELWLQRFPQYKNRDFFLTGESYAGHYVPQLALLMHQSRNLGLNVKGIAIGNPLLNFETDFNFVHVFWWSHGVISDATYKLLDTVCSYARYRREYDQNRNISQDCSNVMNKTSNELGKYFDLYDVIIDVCLQDLDSVDLQSLLLRHFQMDLISFPTNLPLHRMQPKAHEVQKATKEKEEFDVCIGFQTKAYLNRKDVQKALHAQIVGDFNYSSCNMELNYDRNDELISTIDVVGKLVKYGIPVLVYSGDQDSLIPLIGSRANVDNLAQKLGMKTTLPYRSWSLNRQVGGWTQVYDNKLTFATVRGAGHEVPLFQPQRALALFQAFLSGKPLPYE